MGPRQRRLRDRLLELAVVLALLVCGYGVFALRLGSALFWLALAGWLGGVAALALVVLRESMFSTWRAAALAICFVLTAPSSFVSGAGSTGSWRAYELAAGLLSVVASAAFVAIAVRSRRARHS